MLKRKGKIPSWSRLVAWWLCAHHSLHHAALSSAKSRIYMPPPSSRTQWRGASAAAHASPAMCCLWVRPAHGRRDAGAWAASATRTSRGCPCLHQLYYFQWLKHCSVGLDFHARVYELQNNPTNQIIWLRPSFPTRRETILTPALSLAVFPYRWVTHSASPQLTAALGFWNQFVFNYLLQTNLNDYCHFFPTSFWCIKHVSMCSQHINCWPCKTPKKGAVAPSEDQGNTNPGLLLLAQIHGHQQGFLPDEECGSECWGGHPGASSAESRESSHLLPKSSLYCLGLQCQQWRSSNSSCPTWAPRDTSCSQSWRCLLRLEDLPPSLLEPLLYPEADTEQEPGLSWT